MIFLKKKTQIFIKTYIFLRFPNFEFFLHFFSVCLGCLFFGFRWPDNKNSPEMNVSEQDLQQKKTPLNLFRKLNFQKSNIFFKNTDFRYLLVFFTIFFRRPDNKNSSEMNVSAEDLKSKKSEIKTIFFSRRNLNFRKTLENRRVFAKDPGFC